ncbi:MAG: CHAD domain-containing protein [Phycisphaerae bacterium]
MPDPITHDLPEPSPPGVPTGSDTLCPPESSAPQPKPAYPSLLEIGQQRLTQLRTLLDEHRTSTADPDVDFVHDLRVLTRRLSEVVGILDGLLQPSVADALAEVLRQTRKSAGDLRDLDVLDEHLEKWRFPPGLKPLRKRLLAEIPERRSALVKPLRLQLGGATFSEALLVLARTLENPIQHHATGMEKLAQILRKRLRRRARQMRRAFGRAAVKQTSAALHQARIAAKKYRYTLELAAESGLEKGGRTLKFLKTTQSHLGAMHDADVILETLRQHLTDLPLPSISPPGTGTTPTGNFARREQAKAQTARRLQMRDWRRFQKGMAKLQGKRAAEFFGSSYQWMNE